MAGGARKKRKGEQQMSAHGSGQMKVGVGLVGVASSKLEDRGKVV